MGVDQVDHSARIRTTIDVMAERHGQGAPDGIGLEIGEIKQTILSSRSARPWISPMT